MILHVQTGETYKVRVSEQEAVKTHVNAPVVVRPVQGEVYDGEYVFTPTAERQTVPVLGKLMSEDVTIEPIPSNYGRITWDGSTLTVS